MVIAAVEGEVGANHPKISRTDFLTSMFERLFGTGSQVHEPGIGEIDGRKKLHSQEIAPATRPVATRPSCRMT